MKERCWKKSTPVCLGVGCTPWNCIKKTYDTGRRVYIYPLDKRRTAHTDREADPHSPTPKDRRGPFFSALCTTTAGEQVPQNTHTNSTPAPFVAWPRVGSFFTYKYACTKLRENEEDWDWLMQALCTLTCLRVLVPTISIQLGRYDRALQGRPGWLTPPFPESREDNTDSCWSMVGAARQAGACVW